LIVKERWADAAKAAATHGSDVIRKEDAKHGMRDWMLSRTDITAIEPVE
jgi:hypothetical protein